MKLAGRVDRWLWEPVRDWDRKRNQQARSRTLVRQHKSTHDGRAVLGRKKTPIPDNRIGIGFIAEPFHETVRKVLADGGRFFQRTGSGFTLSMMLVDRQGNRVGSNFSVMTCRGWARRGFLVENIEPGIGRAFYLAPNA